MSDSSPQPTFEAPLFSKDRSFDAQVHDWVQHGTELICTTCPGNFRHGSLIPAGMMLVGKRGSWEIVPQHGIPRTTKAAHKPKAKEGKVLVQMG